MQIFNEIKNMPNLALALGYFDGVHIGHQAVIKSAVDFAKRNNTKSAVVTFKDHPCCFFWGVCPKYILTNKERERKIFELGVDYIYELDFESIAHMCAEEYLNEILIKNFEPISISTGYNHHFGHNKSGDANYLEKMSHKLGYKYFQMPAIELSHHPISSTEIRTALSNGELGRANKMLGYNYIIRGKVVEGEKLGAKLGFRTANLIFPSELIDLPFGVYLVEASVREKKYKGIANFGTRPTISSDSRAILETHIPDFDENIYGEDISIEFINMLRFEQKFESLDELKTQIQKDINSIYI